MTGDLSVYVHVPFCTRKCHYCHFYVVKDRPDLQKLYWDHLQKEIQSYQSVFDSHSILTLYLGGGTPSLLAPEKIEALVQTFPSAQEITLEVNPETLTTQNVTDWIHAGVNRFSLGVQSFQAAELLQLGRLHTPDHLDFALNTLLKKSDNVSLDLMFDLPHQTVETFARTLETLKQYPVQHLSLYNLTIEPHTTFARIKHRLNLPNPELSQQLLTQALEALQKQQFTPYEIAAFCRDGQQSQHNIGYWTQRPFVGLGPSSFSYLHQTRFQNSPSLRTWAKQLASDQSPVTFSETLEPHRALREHLVLHLRLLEGVCLETFAQRNGPLPQELLDTLDSLIEQRLILKHGSCIQLSRQGIYVYDSIASELI